MCRNQGFGSRSFYLLDVEHKIQIEKAIQIKYKYASEKHYINSNILTKWNYIQPRNSFLYTRNFDTIISHQLFDYKIMNSQHKNTDSKGNFVLKKRL